MNKYSQGDKVVSNLSGYYMGAKGTVQGKAQVQVNMDTRYNIELDIGKRITLKASAIKLLD